MIGRYLCLPTAFPHTGHNSRIPIGAPSSSVKSSRYVGQTSFGTTAPSWEVEEEEADMCRVGEEEIGEGRAEIDEVEAGGRGRGARGCFDWARVNGMHKEDRNERRRTEGE